MRKSCSAVAPTVILALCVSAAGLTGCRLSSADETADGPVVAVTSTIWADVVSNVACHKPASIESLIPAGVDPHGYKPTLAVARSIEQADLIVANGSDLTGPLEPLLEQAEAREQNVARVTDLVPVTDGDPHIWLDPTRVSAAIDGLVPKLVDSGFDAEAVTACAARYQAELSALDASIAAAVDALGPDQRELVTNHDALGYYADRYGLSVIGTILRSTSTLARANPAELDELAEQIDTRRLSVIFTEGGHAADDARAMARRLDLEVVVLNIEGLDPDQPGYQTYIDLMATNTDLIVDALGRSGEEP